MEPCHSLKEWQGSFKRKRSILTEEWFVYIVECADGTLYCGSTNNIKKRINLHNKGKGAKYTKGRRPVKLIEYRGGMTKSEALSFEYKIKKAKKRDKIKMLKG